MALDTRVVRIARSDPAIPRPENRKTVDMHLQKLHELYISLSHVRGGIIRVLLDVRASGRVSLGFEDRVECCT